MNGGGRRGRRGDPSPQAGPAWIETPRDADAATDGDVAITRLRPRRRPPVLVAVVLAAVVAVALVKPWGEEPVPGPGRPVASHPQPSAGVLRPSPTSPIEAGIREHCLDPGGWRVFAHEGTGEGTIRSWKTLEAAAGTHNPADEAIPVVPVGAPQLQGLGYCAPWRGDDRPPSGATLAVWVLTTVDAARPLAVRRLLPRTANVLGGLFVPALAAAAKGSTGPLPTRSGSDASSWPDGRYVFALQAAGYERWWGVDVVTRRPPPTDVTGPSGTPPP